MVADAGERNKIAMYYAVWVIVCAAVAGLVTALIHTWFFSYNPTRSGLLQTLFSDAVVAFAIAAGQGAVALLVGRTLARFDRVLRATVLLGLLVGVFDLTLYFVQMAIPRTEMGWPGDVTVLVLATIIITVLGSVRASPGPATTSGT
jgi:hypothetical protein